MTDRAREVLAEAPDWLLTNIRTALSDYDKRVQARLALCGVGFAANVADGILTLAMRDSTPEASAPQPMAGGWIEWKGGECPTLKPVQIKFSDGDVSQVEMYPQNLQWRWRQNGEGGDIIAYRIVPSQPNTGTKDWCEEDIIRHMLTTIIGYSKASNDEDTGYELGRTIAWRHAAGYAQTALDALQRLSKGKNDG